MNIETARGIAARIWCDQDFEHMEMDVDLAEEIAKKLMVYANKPIHNKLLIEWANNHYWDSLEKDKDLILKHLRNFGKSIQADQVDAEDLCDCDCHEVWKFRRSCCDLP